MIEAVEVATSDGVLLRGELRRAAATWVVLAHGSGQDLDVWRPLTRALSRRGIGVLCYDLRGHGGSEGEADETRTAADLAEVIGFARREGAELLVVVAAGDTVPTALEAAREAQAAGLVAIAPVGERLGRGPSPKLAVVAAQDPAQRAAGSALQRTSGSAIVVEVPLAGGSAELLCGRWRTNVEAYVAGFVREVSRRAAGVRA